MQVSEDKKKYEREATLSLLPPFSLSDNYLNSHLPAEVKHFSIEAILKGPL